MPLWFKYNKDGQTHAYTSNKQVSPKLGGRSLKSQTHYFLFEVTGLDVYSSSSYIETKLGVVGLSEGRAGHLSK